MNEQKFQKYDLVHVAKDLGTAMSHFTNDIDAIVMYSYSERYGGSDVDSYCLHLKDKGECSWYHECQLTLIESNQKSVYDEWIKKESQLLELHANLDWIFDNGGSVNENPNGTSIQALASCFGLTNLWGRNGEDYTWHRNAVLTMRLASPYLQRNDKAGWSELCERIKSGGKPE